MGRVKNAIIKKWAYHVCDETKKRSDHAPLFACFLFEFIKCLMPVFAVRK